MKNPNVKKSLITLFESLIEDASREEYLQVCKELAEEFSNRLEAALNQIEDEQQEEEE